MLTGPSGWTAERQALTRQMFEDGATASVIAEALGGDITRNAVIGWEHRHGLHRGGQNPPIKIRKKRASKPPATRPKPRKSHHRNIGNITGGLEHRLAGEKLAPVPPSIEDLDIPIDQRRTFDDLEPCHCKWIVGHPREDHFYCGATRVEAEPYCQPHLRRSRTPGSARRPNVSEGLR